mmetsp:Transcript_11808/g.29933  ORF Transcript_11808/g.29933 Transcript_11808/m.29933 type:complete len:445 (-) Transcript_11808:29-1363(-)
MNPPEQAPALKQIYEARLELVRQNEVEIADLKLRLDQAIRRQDKLVTQMTQAKANYEDAASKIVDLLEDNDEKEEEGGGDKSQEYLGNESKLSHQSPGKEKTEEKCKAGSSRNSYKQEIEPAINQSRTPSPSIPMPSNYTQKRMVNEVVDLIDSDVDSDDDMDHIANLIADGNNRKLPPKKRSHSPTTNSARGNVEEDDTVTQKLKREKPSPRESSTPIPTENLTKKNLSKSDDEKKSPTTTRPRSSSTNSVGNRAGNEGNSESVGRKRSSSSTAFTRRIRFRDRTSNIPPERWLKSSVGRTREELNNIDDMVQYMGSCQFGKSVVISMFGTVHAIILNDEANVLVQRNDDYQYWYVGLGPGRKRDARLVGASQSTIPIFHAPQMEYQTKELFYVGHYRVKDIEELNPPIVEMSKERDMKITFAFEKFDERLDSIIKKGPTRKE